jgi:hypothetical protein
MYKIALMGAYHCLSCSRAFIPLISIDGYIKRNLVRLKSGFLIVITVRRNRKPKSKQSFTPTEREREMVTTTIEDVHAGVLSRALQRLDGRSLAAKSCATSSLRALAADPETWRALCLAEWPSLAGLDRRRLKSM